MPRFDGTGPEGKGSKTGRGLGNCNTDKKVSSDTNNTTDQNKVDNNNETNFNFGRGCRGGGRRASGFGRRNGRNF